MWLHVLPGFRATLSWPPRYCREEAAMIPPTKRVSQNRGLDGARPDASGSTTVGESGGVPSGPDTWAGALPDPGTYVRKWLAELRRAQEAFLEQLAAQQGAA